MVAGGRTLYEIDKRENDRWMMRGTCRLDFGCVVLMWSADDESFFLDWEEEKKKEREVLFRYKQRTQ